MNNFKYFTHLIEALIDQVAIISNDGQVLMTNIEWDRYQLYHNEGNAIVPGDNIFESKNTVTREIIEGLLHLQSHTKEEFKKSVFHQHELIAKRVLLDNVSEGFLILNRPC